MIKRNPKWSKAKIIREIKCLFKDNPKITPKEIRLNHSALVGATQYGRYFSGWLQAIKASGLSTTYGELVKNQQKKVILTRRRRQSWSKSKIQQKIISLHKDGVSLGGGYMREHYYHLLHAANHKRYFGSWKKAVESVGINYNALIKARGKIKKKTPTIFLHNKTNNIINRWIRFLHEKNFSLRTIEMYRQKIKMLDRYLGSMNLQKVVEKDIRDFIIYLAKQGYSANTIAHYYSPLNSLFDFCLLNAYIHRSPVKLHYFPRQLGRIPSVITEEELRSFFHYLDNRTIINEWTAPL